jgi:hypothetical protein
MRESGLVEQSYRFDEVTLKYADVLYCIPTEVVLGEVETFPGWQATWEGYGNSLKAQPKSGGSRGRKGPTRNSSNWKKFVEATYEIDLSRDGVKNLAKKAMDVPVDRFLTEAIDEIVKKCQWI